MRQRIGMIFQSFSLLEGLTVIENASAAPVELKGFSKQAAYDKAIALFEHVGLAEKFFSYPDELSGEQKQRAAIVRALIMELKILLFDEPTFAFDPTMVFDAPKRPKTVAFIQRQKFFRYDITARHFDLPAMQSQIFSLAEKYGLSGRYIGRLQLCYEKLIYNTFAAADNLFMKILRSVTTNHSFTRADGLNKICVDIAPP